MGPKVFSVPSRYPEAFGLYVIEALAAGTPVVFPKVGHFRKLWKIPEWGIIYEENTHAAIALDRECLDDSEV